MPWMPGVAAGAVRRAGLRIVERDAGAPDGRTIGLANIAADVPGIEANKEKILAALDVFIEHGDPAKLLALQGLDAAGIRASIAARFLPGSTV